MSETDKNKETEEIYVQESDYVDSQNSFTYPLKIFEDLECVEHYENGKFVKREWNGDVEKHEVVVKDMKLMYPNGLLTRSDDVTSNFPVSCRSVEDIFHHSGLHKFPFAKVTDV